MFLVLTVLQCSVCVCLYFLPFLSLSAFFCELSVFITIFGKIMLCENVDIGLLILMLHMLYGLACE